MAKEVCLFKDDCPFYKKGPRTTTVKILREIYCDTDPSKCEILTKYIRDNTIQENILPDGTIVE